MTLALGSESRNTLGTTGKGLLTTGLTLPIINGKVCFVINLFHQFLSDTTVKLTSFSLNVDYSLIHTTPDMFSQQRGKLGSIGGPVNKTV